jgi:hypothetical protein
LSVNIDSVRALVDKLAGKGVEYAIGLYSFIYTPVKEYSDLNVIETLEPAFGRETARRVYSEIKEAFKDVNMYARVKVGGWEGPLEGYLKKYILEEHISKPILEEAERRLNRISEEDRRILSVACAIIKALEGKDYPEISVRKGLVGSLEVWSRFKDYFSDVVSSVLSVNIPNVRMLFYKYLLGFQVVTESIAGYRYYRLEIYPFTEKYVETLAEGAPRYVKVPDKSVVESRIHEVYGRGEFMKLSVLHRSLHTREPSELLSYFSGMSYEHLCKWAVIEGILNNCFVNPLVIDHVMRTVETLYGDALADLQTLFERILVTAGYDFSSDVESGVKCTIFFKPLRKSIHMCFSPWPEDVGYVEKPPGSISVMVVQGMPSQSILEYLERRSEGMLWLFVKGDKIVVASNTYRDDDHRELLEILGRSFKVEFLGPTYRGVTLVERLAIGALPIKPSETDERKHVSEFAFIKPSREVLEGIVARVLRDLGFSVQTNVRLPAKGGEVEVDVWAFKSVGGSQFRVYVSCKNWDRDVDRHVVDQEFGRVLQLDYMPHLRVLVVKSLTEPARKAAEADGFFVIELGEKASTENSQEIYELVYSKLKEIFKGIAPDRVRDAIAKLKSVIGDLEEFM